MYRLFKIILSFLYEKKYRRAVVFSLFVSVGRGLVLNVL